MWLEKLALPSFDKKIIEEINCCKTCYQQIDKADESIFNKNQKKKEIINIAFEVLVGMFDLGYDIKLKYSIDNLDSESIYVKSLKEDFDTMFYNLYLECFYRYLNKMYLFNRIRLENMTFMIARLACLNNHKDIIKRLANNAYVELLDSDVDLVSDLKISNIGAEDLAKLMDDEVKRVNKLKNDVFNIGVFDGLSNYGIRQVLACFSDHVFSTLDVNQKTHLCALLYNYYTDKKDDNSKKYLREIDEDTDNKKCLNMLIEDLIIPGRTMIVKKKNMDMINDVLSGLPVIYSNEINKYKVGNLNSLKNIIEKIKNSKV